MAMGRTTYDDKLQTSLKTLSVMYKEKATKFDGTDLIFIQTYNIMYLYFIYTRSLLFVYGRKYLKIKYIASRDECIKYAIKRVLPNES